MRFIKKINLAESSRKEGGICYSYGYNPRQLYDTFLVPLCHCCKRFNKRCYTENPPQTVVLSYRCLGSLTLEWNVDVGFRGECQKHRIFFSKFGTNKLQCSKNKTEKVQ